jgi:ubiquinone/menaquinone biosynthesis C-methylase UbiE
MCGWCVRGCNSSRLCADYDLAEPLQSERRLGHIMGIDLQELRGYIADMYTDVAELPRGKFHFPTGRPILELLGYSPELLDKIPSGALESFAGVGYHFDLEPLREGERVLDLGSGAGTDAFFAALQVGAKGHVTGLDMTEAMLEKAHSNLEVSSLSNVSFRKGYAESLPLDDQSFDVVISNGVINLSPVKDTVFSEIRRVLVPGGRLMFSDIVTGVDLPDSVRDNCALWAECIGGAQESKRYLRQIEKAGFKIEKTSPNERYSFSQDSTETAAQKFQVHSISILARRL